MRWNEYTSFSRWVAIVVFLLLIPLLAFYIGREYQAVIDLTAVEATNVMIVPHAISTSTIQTTVATTTSTTTLTTATTTKARPHITSLVPTQGTSGTQVLIKGTEFNSEGNKITFGNSNGGRRPDGSPENVIDTVSSRDGTTLTFTVPASSASGIICSASGECVARMGIRLAPGQYPVSVINSTGTSNTVYFTITE